MKFGIVGSVSKTIAATCAWAISIALGVTRPLAHRETAPCVKSQPVFIPHSFCLTLFLFRFFPLPRFLLLLLLDTLSSLPPLISSLLGMLPLRRQF